MVEGGWVEEEEACDCLKRRVDESQEGKNRLLCAG